MLVERPLLPRNDGVRNIEAEQLKCSLANAVTNLGEANIGRDVSCLSLALKP